jgi:hypothetical protein
VESGMLIEANMKKIVISKRIFRDKYSSKAEETKGLALAPLIIPTPAISIPTPTPMPVTSIINNNKI